jgi:hypothetical protein
MWIANGLAHTKFYIPHSKYFLLLLLVGIHLLFPFGWAGSLLCVFMTIHVTKAARGSPMHVPYVVGKSAFNYQRHEPS